MFAVATHPPQPLFVLVMDGRRVFVDVQGSFQLLVEVHPVELLCLLAGEVGGKCDLTSKCELVWTKA